MFEESSKKCQTAFQTHPYANCILYTDEDCTSDEPGETTPINRAISYVSLGVLRNKVEGISVRQGCTLKIWKGRLKYFEAKSKIFFLNRLVCFFLVDLEFSSGEKFGFS